MQPAIGSRAMTTWRLAYVYFEDEPGRRSAAKLFTKERGAQDRGEYCEAAGADAEGLKRVSGAAILTRRRSRCSGGGGDHALGKARAPSAACLATSPNRKSTTLPQSATSFILAPPRLPPQR